MGIFSASSPFDQLVERATSENNTSDDWSLILEVCDQTKASSQGPKECVKAIGRRLGSENPRIVLQAITLLDACINNCGRKFLLEVASRDFEGELRKHLTSPRTHHKVSERLRECLKKWTEGEFNGDPQLSLIPALYTKLKQEGYDFNVKTDSPKKTAQYSTDPNVVNSKQEEDDIARAIQLSLQDSGPNPSAGPASSARPASTSLYSSATAALTAEGDPPASNQAKEGQKARALYDFEAAEDNELTFKAGEIVLVEDSSDPNWWKGSNHRGQGLFPANFVTLDLNSEADLPKTDNAKRVSFSDCVEVTEVELAPETGRQSAEVTGEIDEEKIDRLLHVLHEADPTGDRSDPPELAVLEEQVNAMAPTIDGQLEEIDRRHAQLARISTDLVDALGLYHQLMRDLPPAPLTAGFYYSQAPPPPSSQLYPGQPGQYPPPFLGPAAGGSGASVPFLPANLPPQMPGQPANTTPMPANSIEGPVVLPPPPFYPPHSPQFPPQQAVPPPGPPTATQDSAVPPPTAAYPVYTQPLL